MLSIFACDTLVFNTRGQVHQASLTYSTPQPEGSTAGSLTKTKVQAAASVALSPGTAMKWQWPGDRVPAWLYFPF